MTRPVSAALLAMIGGHLALGTSAAAADAASLPEAPEIAICGPDEARTFESWAGFAGAADPERAARVPGAEAVSHVTRDGRTLRGYRLPSAAADGTTRRTVLVVGGNAMLADQILGELAMLTEAGLEVFVFDYRGYGQSEGRAMFLPIIGDALELAQRLAPEGGGDGQGPLAFYGISLGGIVLPNVLPHLPDGIAPERVVIDGSRARVAVFGCPSALDPIDSLPADTSHIMFVGGGLDVVVPLSESKEMIEAIEAGGGTTVVRGDFAHPFQDRDPALHQERMRLIRDFLAG